MIQQEDLFCLMQNLWNTEEPTGHKLGLALRQQIPKIDFVEMLCIQRS